MSAWIGLALLAFVIADTARSAEGSDAVPASPPLDEALLRDPAALLREAQAAALRADYDRAERLFDELARRHSIVGDFAGLLRARSLRAAGRAADAQAHVERALSDFPTSPLRAELHALQGDLRRDQGNESGARSAWALAYSESDSAEVRATLLALVAESQERAGDANAARGTWLRLWSRHPASPEAKQADERLDELEARPGAPRRAADDYRQRGDRLFAEMHNEEALEAYDRALEAGLAGNLRTTTQTQRAHTLFRLRRYPEALTAFAALPQRGDVPIWRARSLARADRVPEAIAAFETLARTAGPNQADARSFAASLLEGRQREEEARVHLTWLADDPRQGELSRAALWRLGWSDFRNRRHAEAAERFEALAAATSDPIGRLRPIYWRARALSSAGRDDEAAPLFDALARDFPLSYYGWRARARSTASRAPAERPPLARGQIRLTPSALARVRILIDAGLNEYGAAETGRLVRRAGGLEDRLALARLLTSAADYHTAQRIVVEAYDLALARGPVPGREDVWQLAWPYAYSEYVDAATRAPGSVQPTLVYSIMREESGYRPKVISPVGARGLLQIMRETGALLAARMGRATFDPDELFDPRTNIELGSSYLGELGQLFPKRLSAAIASYNAGPHVVRDWGPGEKRPDDEWVESIPYAETQSYVKRVLRSVEAYRAIYGAQPPGEGERAGGSAQAAGVGAAPGDAAATGGKRISQVGD
ncbi:MAG: transglycosylase SLT domain-containing protein [Deltaproteobacteria bacterium]|nr:transglycosylase SLT domain-containing protein [Deltaproteobacteria bacterium]